MEVKRIKRERGWIEIICGSMFSGKTAELVRRLNRGKIARLNMMVFKSKTDTRYDKNDIVSHDKESFPAIPIGSPLDAISLVGEDVDVVAFDEAQFFEKEIVDVCNKFADMGIRVIVAGLDMDFQRNPFGPMPALMAIAEEVTKVQAICVRCTKPSTFSYRKIVNKELVALGADEEYAPLCRSCYIYVTNEV